MGEPFPAFPPGAFFVFRELGSAPLFSPDSWVRGAEGSLWLPPLGLLSPLTGANGSPTSALIRINGEVLILFPKLLVES